MRPARAVYGVVEMVEMFRETLHERGAAQRRHTLDHGRRQPLLSALRQVVEQDAFAWN